MRGRVFGEVADVYDPVRPGYPDALVDDVLGDAQADPAPALEVGAGTGKATTAFAARSVPVTAVEPDAAMAAVLARRVADAPGVTVVVSSFRVSRSTSRRNASGCCTPPTRGTGWIRRGGGVPRRVGVTVAG